MSRPAPFGPLATPFTHDQCGGLPLAPTSRGVASATAVVRREGQQRSQRSDSVEATVLATAAAASGRALANASGSRSDATRGATTAATTAETRTDRIAAAIERRQLCSLHSRSAHVVHPKH